MASPAPLLRPIRVALVGAACNAPHRIEPNGDWRAGDTYVIGGSGRVIARPWEAVSIRAGLEAAGVLLVKSFVDDVERAVAAAQQADVMIACGQTTSTESLDRHNLLLKEHDFLAALGTRITGLRIDEQRRRQEQPLNTSEVGFEHTRRPFIVLATAPGAILTTGWAEHADAIALLFLGGSQSGNAWADVLLGTLSPSGKLPLTLPIREEDTVLPCRTAGPCHYTEGLHIGWRALVDRPVAFPFGHGLSYAEFTYAWATSPPEHVDVAIEGPPREEVFPFAVALSNSGRHNGSEVMQVYLSYPSSAEEPRLVLRAFAHTGVLQPGQLTSTRFALTRRDLSAWQTHVGWQLVSGTYTLHIGASSRDVRLQCNVEVHPIDN